MQILKELEYAPGGKALLNIPLIRMIFLQVVRPALANDIAKLQADFVHGYRAGQCSTSPLAMWRDCLLM